MRTVGRKALLLMTDVSLSFFLVSIVVFIFILPAFGRPGITGRLVIDIFFTLILVSGVASISERKRVFVLVTAIAAVALVVRWTASLVPLPVLQVLDCISGIVYVLLFCIVTLARVFKAGPITFHRIEGAVAVYLLLGVAWAYAYRLVAYSDPGAFSGAVPVSGGVPPWTFYYSFVTLATLGYGDISPIHPVARSLATAEAITGQLYLAILIARLVSQELFHRQQRPKD